LIKCEVFDVIFREGLIAERKGLSVISMLSEQYKAIESCRKILSHEAGVVIEGPNISFISAIEQDWWILISWLHVRIIEKESHLVGRHSSISSEMINRCIKEKFGHSVSILLRLKQMMFTSNFGIMKIIEISNALLELKGI
jgi:hypothetical protein